MDLFVWRNRLLPRQETEAQQTGNSGKQLLYRRTINNLANTVGASEVSDKKFTRLVTSQEGSARLPNHHPPPPPPPPLPPPPPPLPVHLPHPTVIAAKRLELHFRVHFVNYKFYPLSP